MTIFQNARQDSGTRFYRVPVYFDGRDAPPTIVTYMGPTPIEGQAARLFEVLSGHGNQARPSIAAPSARSSSEYERTLCAGRGDLLRCIAGPDPVQFA
jgi:hypothetical protein